MQKLLPEIPVIEGNKDWVISALNAQRDKALELLQNAQKRYPLLVLKLGDKQSRRWLKKNVSNHLAELDQIFEVIKQPGVFLLNISYEWGCTCQVRNDKENKTPRLIRVLDWPDAGLGENIIAIKIKQDIGNWTSLTWPGYTGTLQAVAKGRFSAAINQAPMDLPTGFIQLDWMINRLRAWNTNFLPPSHLLRMVFETAENFSQAKHMLLNTPIAVPAIYVLAGVDVNETCVIERKPEEANLIEGPACAANSWQKDDWKGCFRGEDNTKRLEMIENQDNDLATDFSWLKPPVYNSKTRLAMICDAKSGNITAQGFETHGAATEILKI